MDVQGFWTVAISAFSVMMGRRAAVFLCFFVLFSSVFSSFGLFAVSGLCRSISKLLSGRLGVKK